MKDKNTKKEKAVLVKVPNAEIAGSQGKRKLIFCGIVAVVIVILMVILCLWIVDFGKDVGQTAGKFAGTVKGSFDGITEGLASGYEAGTEQGLSAEDINVEVRDDIRMMGKLEVLVAEDQLVDKFEEGNSYKALFVYKGKATFTVDLNQAEITSDGSVLRVLLPDLEVDFVIDENESEKIAEWQKFFWSGSTEAGYVGYMNSMEKIKEKTAEEMRNHDYLMQLAKDSAIKQVGILARSVCVEEKRVEIKFKGDA